jgi:hypothetical protein
MPLALAIADWRCLRDKRCRRDREALLERLVEPQTEIANDLK